MTRAQTARPIDLIGLDADDTLWHNEVLYARAEARFADILSAYRSSDGLAEELYRTEMRNLPLFGYGIKSFALSMIETAIGLTAGRIAAKDLLELIALAKEMKQAPVELLDGVAGVIPRLAASCRLMLITKGDLFDQERKVERSGLADHFAYVEILSNKTAAAYRALLARHGIDPRRFLMVGNSLRSDVLPVLEIGGRAVHIPYHLTWAHEVVSPSGAASADYTELEHIGLLPTYLEHLCRQA